MDQGHKSLIFNGQLLEFLSQFRRLIGRLMYLTITRPAIAYSIHHLSQYVYMLRILHFQASQHLVRFLKSNPGQGPLFLLNNHCILKISVILIGLVA